MLLLRILLFPFAIIYDMATRARNHLYNIGNKPSFEFDTNVIGIGNLSVGGTGKTPAVEYLIRLLKTNYHITTLSRGYGRKTKGYKLATDQDNAATIGDEPYQIFQKFKEIHVAVGEQRALAIPEILFQFPENDIVLLDDAYQHRSVKPNVNILLTDYNCPFFRDYLLPAGRLREARKEASRADVVIVTKCPEKIDESVMNDYSNNIKKYIRNGRQIYFSRISYQNPKPVYDEDSFHHNIILISGIADDTRLREFVSERYNLLETKAYGDHYIYSERDIDEIINSFKKLNRTDVTLLTTEKDMVRLLDESIRKKLADYSVYYLPIEMDFVKDGKVFDTFITNSIATK